jgi:hypothetical protein
MHATSVIVFVLFGLALAWYSYVVWFNPDAFLRWARAFRSRWYRVPMGSLSKRMYGNTLDNDPKLELWLARLGVVMLYGIGIFVIGIYVRGGR